MASATKNHASDPISLSVAGGHQTYPALACMMLSHAMYVSAAPGDELDPVPAKTAVGDISVGPRGFLQLLESDLGIVAAAASPAEEVARYRECLAECDRPDRFYHASLRVDPIGVARTLLEWRQTWYLHGWDGTFTSGVSPRLRDMADVEALAGEHVPAGMGQRLRSVLQLLPERRTQIETLTLRDSLDDLPLRWRQVVERLGAQSAPEPVASACPQSDLGKLQALADAQRAGRN